MAGAHGFKPARRRIGKDMKVISVSCRTLVTWDPDECERRAAGLCYASGRELVSNGQEADEIIFCEGPAFRFSDCIEALQKIRRGVSCKIHAAGSGSAAGSYSKEERGQRIVLPQKR